MQKSCQQKHLTNNVVQVLKHCIVCMLTSSHLGIANPKLAQKISCSLKYTLWDFQVEPILMIVFQFFSRTVQWNLKV